MEKLNAKLVQSRQKLTELPFRKIAPNIVTMLALCAGVTSIRYSVQADWVKAVVCIFLAAFLTGWTDAWRGCLKVRQSLAPSWIPCLIS